MQPRNNHLLESTIDRWSEATHQHSIVISSHQRIDSTVAGRCGEGILSNRPYSLIDEINDRKRSCCHQPRRQVLTFFVEQNKQTTTISTYIEMKRASSNHPPAVEDPKKGKTAAQSAAAASGSAASGAPPGAAGAADAVPPAQQQQQRLPQSSPRRKILVVRQLRGRTLMLARTWSPRKKTRPCWMMGKTTKTTKIGPAKTTTQTRMDITPYTKKC